MPAGCVIGVDLGGTKLLAGAVDRDLAVHHRASRRSRSESSEELLEKIAAVVSEVREVTETEVLAVGIGIPSLMDLERGVPGFTAHLPLVGLPVRDIMSERLALPVFVANDATLAMLAEHRFGAARGCSDAVLLTLGTGIGGGLVVGGRLAHGAVGAAGEPGHMVVDVDGPPCACGSVGCLETLASGSALGREGARVARAAPADSPLGRALASGREITGALVTELAHDGDRAARDVVALIGMRLGVGIANLVNLLNPQVVVVGGGLIAAGDMLLEPARTVVRERALPPSRDVVSIVPSRFGAEAGMLGAALFAYDGFGAAAAAA
ncbi:MAG TPA: ROK family protein [Solirubrobacteraceae bacterium]|nr:ROK family protein [Solirubrobacteraceae bacterium]